MNTINKGKNTYKTLRYWLIVFTLIVNMFAIPISAHASDRTAARNTVTRFLKASKGKDYKKLNACCSTKLFGPGYSSKSYYMNKYRLKANKSIKYSIKDVKQSGKTALVKAKVTYKSAFDAYYNEFLNIISGNFQLTSDSVITSFEQYYIAHPAKKKTKTFKLYLKKKSNRWVIDTTDSTNVRAIGDFLYCDLSSAVTAAYRAFWG